MRQARKIVAEPPVQSHGHPSPHWIDIEFMSLIASSARLTDQKIPIVGRLVTIIAAEISEKLGYEKIREF